MESDSGISEALSYSVMQNKENSWISQEIIQEYKDKLQSNQFDLNGCDVTLISVTKEKFFAHEMILAAQSPIFRRSLRQGVPSDCKWSSTIVEAFLNFLYGIDSHIKEKYQIVELLLCATYYQVEWLCQKLSDDLVRFIKKSEPVDDEKYLDFCYKLVLLLQDMDQAERKPFDRLVAPLFEFCSNKIKQNAAESTFPNDIDLNSTLEIIQKSKWPLESDEKDPDPLQLLLSFCPLLPDEDFSRADVANMLRNQLYGRICIVQKMMLEAVKSAQRQFPTRIFYKQEAAALIKIGDKVIQEDNVAEKYFHSRHNGIGHVISFCTKTSTGIGCGGCGKHLFVDWGDQRCWCRMGYEGLYELKLLR